MPGKLFLIQPEDLEDKLSTEHTIDKINKSITILILGRKLQSTLAGFHVAPLA